MKKTIVPKPDEVKYNMIKKFVYGKVVDIGCGNAFFKEVFNAAGIDIDKNSNADIIASVFDLSRFKENEFDTAIFFEVFEEIPHPELAIMQIRRISKRLILSTPNYNWFRKLIGKEKLHPLHYKEYSWKEVKSIVEKEGYKMIYFGGLGFMVGHAFPLFYTLGKLFPKLSSKMVMVFDKK